VLTQLKRRITTAVGSIAFLLFTVTGANATTYDLGTLSSGTTSFSAGSLGSQFTNDYRFFLTTISDIYATVSGIGLSNLSMNLFRETTVGKKGKITNVFVTRGTTFSFANLAAGQYFLEIKGGPGNMRIPGSYSGSLTIAAVPEPEVWAMMLIGVGLVGCQMRRKLRAGPVKIAG
jgi:hypothetical protein